MSSRGARVGPESIKNACSPNPRCTQKHTRLGRKQTPPHAPAAMNLGPSSPRQLGTCAQWPLLQAFCPFKWSHLLRCKSEGWPPRLRPACKPTQSPAPLSSSQQPGFRAGSLDSGERRLHPCRGRCTRVFSEVPDAFGDLVQLYKVIEPRVQVCTSRNTAPQPCLLPAPPKASDARHF